MPTELRTPQAKTSRSLPSRRHADDAADAGLLVELHLLRREHVERLSERDVELVVRPDAAHARGVVIGFLLAGNQLTLLHDNEGGDVRAFVEELGCGENKHAVLLGDEQKAVLGEAHPIRDDETDRRRELLDLVGHAVLVAVGDGPHLALARTDERHHALRSDGHVAGIRYDGIKADLEPSR